MKTSSTLASILASSSLLVGCVGGDDLTPGPNDPDQQDPADDDQDPAFLPRSCGEISDRTPTAKDGEYTLYFEADRAKPWKAYCHDFAGNTSTWLVLPTGFDMNFSYYTSGNFSGGIDVRTDYTRVKINAFGLTIDIGDQTFATSRGTAFHQQDPNKPITSMPFGVAATCGGGLSIANITLTGTPFLVKDTFVTKGGQVTGIAPDGGVIVSAGNKVLDLFADGACATTAPTAAPDEPFNQTGGFVLTLEYVK